MKPSPSPWTCIFGMAVCLLLAVGCSSDSGKSPEEGITALCEADGESPSICACIAETLSEHLNDEDVALVADALESGRNSDELAALLSKPEFEEAFVASAMCGAQ